MRIVFSRNIAATAATTTGHEYQMASVYMNLFIIIV